MSKSIRPSNCCKCQSIASKFCDSCDLHYCGTCCHYRHRQGSFLRHSIVNIDLNVICDECNTKEAVLRCNACELDYCSKCSQEIHQHGTMQSHIKDHKFDLYPSLPVPRDEEADTIGSSLASAIAGVHFENSPDIKTRPWNNWEICNPEVAPLDKHDQWSSLLHIDLQANVATDKGGDDGASLSPTRKHQPWSSLSLQQSEKNAENFGFNGNDPTWIKCGTSLLNDDNGGTKSRPVDTRPLSVSEIDKLVTLLSSPRPTRQLVIRSMDGVFERSFFDALSDELKYQTALKKFHTGLIDSAVLVVAYFDIKSAINAKNNVEARIAQSAAVGGSPFNRLVVNFSVPFAKTSKGVDDGKLLIFPVDPAIQDTDVQALFAQHGEVIGVYPSEISSDHRFVEYNDIRDCQNALRNINGTVQWGKQLQVGFAPLANEVDDKSCQAMRMVSGSPERVSKPHNSFASVSAATEDNSLIHNCSNGAFNSMASFQNSQYMTMPGNRETFASLSPITGYPAHFSVPSYGTPPQRSGGSQHGLGGYYSAYYNDFGTFDTWGRRPAGQGGADDGSGRIPQMVASEKSRAVHPISSTPPHYHAQPYVPPVYSNVPAPVHSRGQNTRKKRESGKHSENRHGGRNDQGSGEYGLIIDNVDKGIDKRTTLMVRNIPNKYSQQMLLAEIKEKHMGKFDFFYLPIDFKNKCNMGYAFINFIDHRSILSFYEEFNDLKWKNFNSEKICAISYARLQGKAAMIARFQNSSLLEKDESYRPLVFCSTGIDQGNPEPFPMVKKPNTNKGNGENSGTELVPTSNGNLK